MPYRLDPAARFPDAVNRVAATQLGRAIEALETRPAGLHEAIHEARKKLKRVRALFRLVAREQKDFRRTENERLKAMARSLSAVRDATALVEAVSWLADHAASDEEQEALERTREALVARRDRVAAEDMDIEDRTQAAIRACHDAMAALDAVSFAHAPRKVARLLAKAWKKNLERAADARDACHQSSHSELFHGLRKAAQNHWMHLSLLRDLWPSAIAAKRTEVKRLVDLLGHEHDMSLLVELIDAEPGLVDGEAQSHLIAAIIRRQQAVRAEALTLADSVFADAPEREAAVIGTLWIEAATG